MSLFSTSKRKFNLRKHITSPPTRKLMTGGLTKGLKSITPLQSPGKSPTYTFLFPHSRTLSLPSPHPPHSTHFPSPSTPISLLSHHPPLPLPHLQWPTPRPNSPARCPLFSESG